MKISWSPLSFDRLESIYEFVVNEDPIAAKNLIIRIFNKVDSLSKYAERGRKVPEINRNDIREVFESEYTIIYKIETKKIIILTIRNFKELLPTSDTKKNK